jgi:hypothetical protein
VIELNQVMGEQDTTMGEAEEGKGKNKQCEELDECGTQGRRR